LSSKAVVRVVVLEKPCFYPAFIPVSVRIP